MKDRTCALPNSFYPLARESSLSYTQSTLNMFHTPQMLRVTPFLQLGMLAYCVQPLPLTLQIIHVSIFREIYQQLKIPGLADT